MKNSIWVGKNNNGGVYIFPDEKPTIKNGELCGSWVGGMWILKFLNIELQRLDIVEIIHDTETGEVEVKRPREIGWYLVECMRYDNDGLVFACHWDGENWVAVPNKKKWKRGTEWLPIAGGEVTVLSEKLPDNPYLKSLE